MTIPHETIDKLAETWASISSLGAGLTEAQWKTSTDLPAWTVQDNLSHIVGTERMLEGLPPAEHSAPGGDHVKNPIGEHNEREVDARRGRSGADVLAEWDELAAQRLTTLRNADEAYFATESFTPTGPGTVADFLHIRVMDCWAHEQDMRRALARPGNNGTGSAAHAIDRLARTLGIVVGKRAGTPEGGAVTIELTGPVHRSTTLEVQDGRAKQVDEPTRPSLAVIRMSSDTFATLALGRRPAAAMLDEIDITGDETLGHRVIEQFNMMI
jgi:uncharacterized protein (TIGR03083 family)